MAKTIHLHVIRTKGCPAVPPLILDGKSLPDWYSEATGGHMRLDIVAHTSNRQGVDVDGAGLHQIIRDILPIPGSRPVSDIALVFCRNWKLPEGLSLKLYGLMFDYDGSDPDLGYFSSGEGVPREAAAVFTDALRGGDDDAVYTAIHELGHVFNLGHDTTNSSFMAERGFTQRHFRLEDAQNIGLAAQGLEGFEWNYLPGGANFLHFTGGHGLVAKGRGRADDGLGSAPPLRLKARLAKQHYLLAESVVLDLELSGNGERPVDVPTGLDPGHPSLAIWYQNPWGEKRRYRPIFTYCQAGQAVTQVSKGAPLRHNPRITVGAEGFTFPTPGPYRVWAEFSSTTPQFSGPIVSNVVEFELRFSQTSTETSISRVLCDRTVAFFVANKGGRLAPGRRRDLLRVAESAPAHDAVRHVRYALAASAQRRRDARSAAKWLKGLRLDEPSLREGAERMRRWTRHKK